MSSGISRIKKIGIIGAGQMGTGIAQIASQMAQLTVSIYDSDPDQLRHCKPLIESRLSTAVSKGKLSEKEKMTTLDRLCPMSTLEDFRDVDMVIEAAKEDTKVKLDLFRRLSFICSPEAILASNTSSISITKLASATTHPERVINNIQCIITNVHSNGRDYR
jgi:3-hydroxybutyryl-CoA dehydrogenase